MEGKINAEKLMVRIKNTLRSMAPGGFPEESVEYWAVQVLTIILKVSRGQRGPWRGEPKIIDTPPPGTLPHDPEKLLTREVILEVEKVRKAYDEIRDGDRTARLRWNPVTMELEQLCYTSSTAHKWFQVPVARFGDCSHGGR